MKATLVVAGDDRLLPFQVDRQAVRGRLVRLGAVVDEILTRHQYPPAVARMLGQTLALACLLAGALKYDGVFTLQTRGDGPIGLMVADVTSAGHLRGYAQFDAAKVAAAEAGTVKAEVPRLLGAGYLAFTVDQGPDTERYQGIVALEGGTLGECVHHYFQQSEQIGAGISLACHQIAGAWRAGGIMLNRLPDEGGEATLSAEEAEDGWRRALLLLGTATETELVDPSLAANDVLFRLFHEDGVRVYAARDLIARCRCSLDRVSGMLASLPPEDRAHLAVDGKIEVTCEFCNQSYELAV